MVIRRNKEEEEMSYFESWREFDGRSELVWKFITKKWRFLVIETFRQTISILLIP